MKNVRLLLATALLCHSAAAFAAGEGVDMVVKRVLDNKLQLSVPQSFQLMSEEKRLEARYQRLMAYGRFKETSRR